MNKPTTSTYLRQKQCSFTAMENLFLGSMISIIRKNRISRHSDSLNMAEDPMQANLNYRWESTLQSLRSRGSWTSARSNPWKWSIGWGKTGRRWRGRWRPRWGWSKRAWWLFKALATSCSRLRTRRSSSRRSNILHPFSQVLILIIASYYLSPDHRLFYIQISGCISSTY